MVELAIDLRLELRYALTPIVDFRRAIDCLREAERLATELGDRHRLGWIFMNMANPLYALGEREHALEVSRRAIAIAADLGDVPLQAEGHFNAALIHFARGEYHRAIDLLRWSVRALQGDLIRVGTPGVASVLCRSLLAWCLACLGQFPDALSTAEEGVRIAEMIGQPYSRSNAHLGVGWTYLYKGEFSQATSWLQEALSISRTANIEALFPWAVASLGLAFARAGRAVEALRLVGEVFRPHDGLDRFFAHVRMWLGEIHLLAELPDHAQRLVWEAIEFFRQSGERGREAEASCLLGAIALAARPPDPGAAEVHYRHALQLATELEMRPLVAHCHLGLGQLYRRTGDEAKAKEHLTTAATMYREMGMDFWLEQADAELGGVEP